MIDEWLVVKNIINKSPSIFLLLEGSFTAATDLETLKQRNITHILTLDICPLPTHITEIPYLTTKYIHGKWQ